MLKVCAIMEIVSIEYMKCYDKNYYDDDVLLKGVYAIIELSEKPVSLAGISSYDELYDREIIYGVIDKLFSLHWVSIADLNAIN